MYGILNRTLCAVCVSGALLLTALPASASGAQDSVVLHVLQSASYPSASVGMQVVDLGSGDVRAAHRADSMMVPASVAKLVTAAASFELLDQSYRFGTVVRTDGRLVADSGVLEGNLYLTGAGDPGFVAERLWLLVRHVRQLGIRRVTGSCILDDSFLDTVVSGPGFTDDRSSRSYDAPVGALTANFNSIEVHVRAGDSVGSAVQVDVFPPVSGIRVHNRAQTVAAGGGRRASVSTELRDGQTHVIVTGSMAVGSRPRVLYRKVWETTANFARVFAALCEENGVVVDGTVRPGGVPDSVLAQEPLYVFKSQPLSVYVGYLFKFSNNITAELLYKTIGATRTGVGSWDSARAEVGRWWRQTGLPGQYALVNGSGMGTANRISAAQVTALLRHVYGRKDYYPDYCAALSNAGIDGTLSDRFTRSPLRGLVRAKTGTLNSSGVSSLAGYAFIANTTFAFAIIVNDTTHGQFEHWTLQERLLEEVLLNQH